MKSYRDPVHRHQVLEHERAIEPALFHPTDEEVRQAARFLGREDRLPDPQQDWLAPSA